MEWAFNAKNQNFVQTLISSFFFFPFYCGGAEVICWKHVYIYNDFVNWIYFIATVWVQKISGDMARLIRTERKCAHEWHMSREVPGLVGHRMFWGQSKRSAAGGEAQLKHGWVTFACETWPLSNAVGKQETSVVYSRPQKSLVCQQNNRGFSPNHLTG